MHRALFLFLIYSVQSSNFRLFLGSCFAKYLTGSPASNQQNDSCLQPKKPSSAQTLPEKAGILTSSLSLLTRWCDPGSLRSVYSSSKYPVCSCALIVSIICFFSRKVYVIWHSREVKHKLFKMYTTLHV